MICFYNFWLFFYKVINRVIISFCISKYSVFINIFYSYSVGLMKYVIYEYRNIVLFIRYVFNSKGFISVKVDIFLIY